MPSIPRITGPGLLTAAGTLACVATLAGFAGRLWWVFELASHFRVQYALALGLCALAMLIWRHILWGAIFGALALLNTAMLGPRFPITAEAAASSNEPDLRVLLANVNSANRDYPRIHRVIAGYDPDFIVLLEVTPRLLEQVNLADRYPYRIAAPREDNFGIALFSRKPFLKAEIVPFGISKLPSTVAEFSFGERRFTLLGTHPLPPVNAGCARSRNDQLAVLAGFAQQSRQPLLLVGDLNVSPWSPYFAELLAAADLRDSASGRGIQPSWPTYWPPLWIPIDHALFSEGIQIRHRETGPDIGSDHYPVIVDFQLTGS